MLLKRLRLRHFRTYDDLDLRPLPGITLIHGPNASGKTNLLEAIFVLATTKSFRTRTDRDLIAWNGHEEPSQRYTRLECDAEARNGPVRVEMVLVEQPRGEGEGSVKKQLKLNSSAKRAGDVVGSIKAVLFSPDDCALVTGTPSLRRRFLDLTLCQIDHKYLRLLQEYGRVLSQRNSLLQRLRGRPEPITLLEFWDDRLVSFGVEIMSARKAMFRVLNDFAREGYTDLSGFGEELTIAYRPSLDEADDVVDLQLPDLFRQRLAQLQTKEIYQGVTLCGPHRDDLQFLINGVDAQYFGSRGQQRTIALALRLAEMRYMTNRTGEQPLLLLDEAMAELDEDRRSLLLRLIETHPQALVTTSNLDAFPTEFRNQATLLHIEAGRVAIQHPLAARAS